MVAMVMKAGECAVNTMALLDEANTTAYGHPEITEVNIGVGKNPGILIFLCSVPKMVMQAFLLKRPLPLYWLF